MGELVNIAGTPTERSEVPPEGTLVRNGQWLFGEIVDAFAAKGVTVPRGIIAISVRQGGAALKDGVDETTVVASCLAAIRRGRPELTSRIITDVVLAQAGLLINTHAYNREIRDLQEQTQPLLPDSIQNALDEINGRRTR